MVLNIKRIVLYDMKLICADTLVINNNNLNILFHRQ